MFITVTVNDPSDSSLVDAAVHVELVTAKGNTLAGDGNTGPDGVVVFRYNTSKRDGSGTYTVTATASAAGYNPGDATTTFTVS